MPLIICEKCGCVDNTTCGSNYWMVLAKQGLYKDDYANKHILCVECLPKEYFDGSINHIAGRWHNRFIKRHWSEFGTREELLRNSDFVNAKEYFENLDKEIEENDRKQNGDQGSR